MSLALHCFDSTAKPFTRCVVFFEAVLATAQSIADERKHQTEGKEAAAFLASVSVEECLTLGLLADAGEESLVLTRYLDSEQYEKATLQVELCNFLARIKSLFVKKQCWQIETSYSRLMLTFLMEPRTLFFSKIRHAPLEGTIKSPQSF